MGNEMGRPAVDITGSVFGRLTVLRRDGRKPGGAVHWVCQCSCGRQCTARGTSLRRGETSNCGCGWHPSGKDHKSYRHGMTGSVEFRTWQQMLQRCDNQRNGNYPHYGGRGISVCDRWRASFQAFFDDMGPRPDGRFSLERLNNDRNYEASNCVWADYKTQERNRRSNRLATFNGRTQPVSAWADELNFPAFRIYARLSAGWSVERALSTPARAYRKKI